MDCSLQYAPLREESKEIRVLRLFPGAFDDNIRCNLSVTSVQSKFEALSYVWGDPNNKKPIEVNGGDMEVTHNLERALRYLRDRNEIRTLWVDAVCINQNDLCEQRQQVGMMGVIYEEAERVIAWLGAIDHENAVPAIKAFGNNLQLHWDPNNRSSTDPDVALNPLTVLLFIRNPWFERVWTLQEAVLAKSMTYIYGLHAIPQPEMEGFLKSFARHMVTKRCCSFGPIVGDRLETGVLIETSILVNHIDDLVRLKKRGGFLEVASKARHRQATNPLDKVFGLLGLVEDLPRDIIDYEKSVSFVYSRTAFEHIKTTGHLDILSHVLSNEPHSSPATDHSLPSWVPDWTDSTTGELYEAHTRSFNASIRQVYNNSFKACKDSQAHPICSDPFKQLHLEGYFFDKIVQVEQARPIRTDDMSMILEWRESLNVDREPERAYVAGSTNLESFWRTLCSSIDPASNYRMGEVREISEHTRQLHDDWWWEVLKASVYHLPNTLESEVIRSFSYHVNTIANGRRLIVSQRGYIGLASGSTQIGDEIWLLCGGRVPHILRSQANESGSSLGQDYTFVSDSYIHGIMKGEYWEELAGNGMEPTTVVLS